MTPITVLLADDDQVIRSGLRSSLKLDLAIKIIGEARNGREAVRLTKKLRPDVVVMDMSMPVLNGLEATQEILSAFPKTRILVLSAHNDEGYIERAAAIGAAGYVVKHSSAQDITRMIREVHEGKTVFSPNISKRLRIKKPAPNAEPPQEIVV